MAFRLEQNGRNVVSLETVKAARAELETQKSAIHRALVHLRGSVNTLAHRLNAPEEHTEYRQVVGGKNMTVFEQQAGAVEVHHELTAEEHRENQLYKTVLVMDAIIRYVNDEGEMPLDWNQLKGEYLTNPKPTQGEPLLIPAAGEPETLEKFAPAVEGDTLPIGDFVAAYVAVDPEYTARKES